MDEMWQNHSVNLRCGQSLRQSDISMFASEKVYQELKNLIDSDRSKNTFPSQCGNNSTCREVYHSSEKCASQPGSCPILVSSHFREYWSVYLYVPANKMIILLSSFVLSRFMKNTMEPIFLFLSSFMTVWNMHGSIFQVFMGNAWFIS